MGTIAEKLQNIASVKSGIASALVDRGKDPPAKFADYPEAIRSLPVISESPPHPCNMDDESESGSWLAFIDYDGTPLFSYTMAEAAALTAMPPVPDHSDLGLVNGAWNWSLSDVATAVSRKLPGIVGPNYYTEDDATWLDLDIRRDDYTNVSVNVGGSSVTVDWGDGSATETATTSAALPHVYAHGGKYRIKLKGSSNYTVGVNDSRPIIGSYGNEFLTGVYVARNASLARQTVSNGLFWTTLVYPPNYSAAVRALNQSMVRAIITPRNTTALEWQQVSSMWGVKVISTHPRVLYPVNQVLYNNRSLKWLRFTYLRIASGTGGGALGNANFQNQVIRVLRMPEDMTVINNSGILSGMKALERVIFPASPTKTVTSIGNTAFNGDSALYKLENFNPSPITTLGTSVFNDCRCLFSEGIAFDSLSSIGEYAFRYCPIPWMEIGGANVSLGGTGGVFRDMPVLHRLTFRRHVASVPANTFLNDGRLRELNMSHCRRVPALANVNAFQGTSTANRIVVPDALYDEWVAASNWSSTTNNIVSCLVKASVFNGGTVPTLSAQTIPELSAGGTHQMSVSTNSTGEVHYASYDTAVATVDWNTGLVTAVAAGSGFIVVYVDADGGFAPFSIKVSITVV